MIKKSKTKSSKINWGTWMPVIAAFVAGIFGIIYILIPKSTASDSNRKTISQKSDSGDNINYSAGRDMSIDKKVVNNYFNDTDSKIKVVQFKTLPSPKISQKIIEGDNNVVIEGNNNTVNKYGLDLNKPKTKFFKGTSFANKFKLQSPLDKFIKGDSLFKYVIDFEYLYQLRAGQMSIYFKNCPEIEYIDFHYTTPGMHSISKENISNANGDIGIKISNPVNGKMQLEIFSSINRKDYENKLFISVDTTQTK